MRRFIALMFLVIVPMNLGEMAVPATASESAEKGISLYDPNPAHIWNRLYDALLLREDPAGGRYGEDSLEPLLWLNSEHLLAQPSHQRALRILDEFLQTHAENQIHDPVKRAVLQRDLWAVFDWSAQQESLSQRPTYDEEKRELQTRLAEVLRRLALTPEEIASLPANYGQAVASGAFAKEYDPAHRERAFLPPDLFDSLGPWVCINGNSYFGRPVAIEHLMTFSGRSRFLVFVRLPGGRKATLEYFRTLWNFPQPWVQSDPRGQADVNPDLPSFPAGTQVVLLRQMTLFDNRGNLVDAPVTESVQMRVYRTITTAGPNGPDITSLAALGERSGQIFYEIKLSRPQLFANRVGGLRATGPDEIEFSTLRQEGDDVFEWWVANRGRPGSSEPALQMCVECHSGGGINSLNSRAQLLKPNAAQPDPAATPPDRLRDAAPQWWTSDNGETIDWKHDRYDWGLLKGYWKSSGRFH
ncbi:MAG: hypothetical protein WB799_21115 [Candidatus Sulfotelmatobacter sp.]